VSRTETGEFLADMRNFCTDPPGSPARPRIATASASGRVTVRLVVAGELELP
jgi:hypothetical protein